MTNRTVQIYGYGYGPTDATMIVTFDGAEVFNGAVATTNAPVPNLPGDAATTNTVPLCSFEFPVDAGGKINMTCQVTNGTILFANIKANYGRSKNPKFSDADLAIIQNFTESTHQERFNVYAALATPPFSQDETNTLLDGSLPFDDPSKVSILLSHDVFPTPSFGPDTFVQVYPTDPRTNVAIDNEPQTKDATQYPDNVCWWTVDNGSTLSYTVSIFSGTTIGA